MSLSGSCLTLDPFPVTSESLSFLCSHQALSCAPCVCYSESKGRIFVSELQAPSYIRASPAGSFTSISLDRSLSGNHSQRKSGGCGLRHLRVADSESLTVLSHVCKSRDGGNLSFKNTCGRVVNLELAGERTSAQILVGLCFIYVEGFFKNDFRN
ncbi:hypothetical protein EI94DRAFT_463162 [Lactarius quietus]|nr:hypothetical protein EI94DRAFT_463162 [Lactarius quietus]